MTEENPEDAYYNNPAVIRNTYGNFETILITLMTFFLPLFQVWFMKDTDSEFGFHI